MKNFLRFIAVLLILGTAGADDLKHLANNQIAIQLFVSALLFAISTLIPKPKNS